MDAKSKYILIVEDNDDLRYMYKQCLTYEGFEVIEAVNGQVALDMLQSSESKPGLIILDLMMPVLDGWEFLKQREANVLILKIPVVVCSAASENLPTNIPVLRKPVDRKTLISFVNKYFQVQ